VTDRDAQQAEARPCLDESQMSTVLPSSECWLYIQPLPRSCKRSCTSCCCPHSSSSTKPTTSSVQGFWCPHCTSSPYRNCASIPVRVAAATMEARSKVPAAMQVHLQIVCCEQGGLQRDCSFSRQHHLCFNNMKMPN
jgi:hypothetical protein